MNNQPRSLQVIAGKSNRLASKVGALVYAFLLTTLICCNRCIRGHKSKNPAYPICPSPVSIQSTPTHQSGAVLIISLIMLLLLTLIGTTSMQSSSLEEKMVGNMRSRDLAFQAAEAALRGAETTLCPTSPCAIPPITILPLINKTITTCTNGLCPYSSTVMPEWGAASFDWVTNGSAYSGSLPKVVQAPRYVIEIIAPALSGSTIITFRITAIAWGGDANTVVKLQTIYKINYSGFDSSVI